MNCQLINVRSFSADSEGILSVFEKGLDISFNIKRVYYITGADVEVHRGFHAHKKLKQVLFCPYGRIVVIVDNGEEKKEYLLDSPQKALVIEPVIWREMIWKKKESVLVVAVSDNYKEDDYIRDYNVFIKYVKQEEKCK